MATKASTAEATLRVIEPPFLAREGHPSPGCPKRRISPIALLKARPVTARQRRFAAFPALGYRPRCFARVKRCETGFDNRTLLTQNNPALSPFPSWTGPATSFIQEKLASCNRACCPCRSGIGAVGPLGPVPGLLQETFVQRTVACERRVARGT